MSEKQFVAHIADDGRTQTVKDHLGGTAKLAGKFAAAFGCRELGELVGRMHDIGKYSEEFQNRILKNGPRCDHSTAGGIECAKADMDYVGICAMGHHTGLPDGGLMASKLLDDTYIGRLKKGLQGGIPDYSDWKDTLQKVGLPDGLKDEFDRTFFIRMLYSCLVDADFLDTEAFMQGRERCSVTDDMSVLLDRFKQYVTKWSNPKSSIDQYRTDILQNCVAKGCLPQGLYSLTVPTGGGKTTSSLGFALEHAVAHHLDRVIYVIPYTSIIEQNAEVFRDILGDNNVLEFHSGYEGLGSEDNQSETDYQMVLSSENWDVPVVVTTAVQFFESLYANKSSKCRKLHNLANSVIVFDEAQLLPIGHLKPCVAAMAQLVKNYHSTVVLMTATCPAFDTLFREYGLSVAELGTQVSDMYEQFKRVTLQYAGRKTKEELADELQQKHQALCIVNTRQMAFDLYQMLPQESTYHLSTLLCSVDRKRILSDIRKRLKDGKACRVVATSLIEAGVDVDFPCVYREIAGLDSILQAAGRCNREGIHTKEESIVTVFESEKEVPRNFKMNVGAFRHVQSGYTEFDSLAAIRAYFEELYHFRGYSRMDECGILDAFQNGIPGTKWPFKTMANRFHLISTMTRTVYVPLDEALPLIEQLRYGKITKRLFRKLASYGVTVYDWQYKQLLSCGKLDVLCEDVAVLNDMELYNRNTGLVTKVETGNALFY